VEALGEIDPLASLLSEVVAEGHEQGAAFADFYCTTSRFAAALERTGFVREEALDMSLPSRLQPLQQSSKPLTAALRLGSWTGDGDPFAGEDVYFTRSDCDQDRPS
jgi:hypothetical protein